MDRPNAFHLEKNQDSRGGLITLDSEDKEQDSRGDLNNDHVADFASSPPIIVELATNEIQPFQIIPDYDSSTNSPFPIVVKSPMSCHCIDGWDKVELSLIQNQPTLTCHVFYIPEYSETEIAIRKVAVRTMPQGGTCSYAERVRNASILFKMMMTSTDHPVVFSHGGSRRGADYTESEKNNIRILLANRLGKSVTTISKYLNHGEFLNSEAIDALIKAGTEKGFFEAAQPYKREILDDLKSAHKSDVEISAAVSEAMLSLLRVYRTKKNLTLTYNQADQNENLSSEMQNQPNLANRSASKPKQFSHWSGNSSAVEEIQTTEDEVRREIKVVGSELIKVIDNKDLTAHQMVETVSSQIVRLAELLQQLKQLENLNTETKEENNNG